MNCSAINCARFLLTHRLNKIYRSEEICSLQSFMLVNGGARIFGGTYSMGKRDY